MGQLVRFNAQFTEAIGGADGSPPIAWKVRLINAGVSKNGNDWPLKVLHESAPMFDGVRALARSDEEHTKGTGIHPKSVTGWFSNTTPVTEGLDSTFNISEAAGWLKTMLWDGWQRGKKDLVGLSLVADVAGVYSRTAEGMVRKVNKIGRVKFVDVVVQPGAGGQLMGLAESEDPEGKAGIVMLERLLKLCESLAPEAYKKLDLTAVTEAQVIDILDGVKVKIAEGAPTPEASKAADAAGVDLTKITESINELTKLHQGVLESMAAERTSLIMNGLLTESKLPDDAQQRVRDMVALQPKAPGKTEIEKFIASEAAYLAKHSPRWEGPRSSGRRVEMRVDALDKWKAAACGLVFNERQFPLTEAEGAEKIESFRSVREAYIALTGDTAVTGMVEDAPYVGRTSEAAIDSSTFGLAMGEFIRKKMQKDYTEAGLEQWRLIANVSSVQDFRAQKRPQIGGFGELDVVTEGNAYTETWTEPDDASVGYGTPANPTFTVSKYGNLQCITLETILNDDVGVIQRMPTKMARAAKRTLNTAFWAPLVANSAWSGDGGAIFQAALNRGSTAAGNYSASGLALSLAALKTARLLMRKQTEPNSGARLGLNPKWLFVPADLESEAVELCYANGQPSYNSTAGAGAENPYTRPNFLSKFGLTPVEVPSLSDATDWYLAADKADIDIMEVGFLGGKEEPELFLQDMPTVGSMFTHDKLTYKLRFIFGVCCMDYRGLYKSVVAG